MQAIEKVLKAALIVAAFSMAAYQLWFAVFQALSTTEHVIIHLGFAVLVVALAQVRGGTLVRRLLAIIALLIGVAASVYLLSQADDLEIRYGIALTAPELIAGIAIIAAVFILSWTEWGASLTILGLLALVYFFFGSYLPGALQASPFPSFDFAMTFLVSGGGSGIYGQLTPVSANVIFYFMLFGALLELTGLIWLFVEIGNLFGRVLKGGAAIMTVIASSLLGTITGATVANVAVMGNFTIPAMKSQGFKPSDAGAIEAVSSLGGQIMPPVMGIGAFIMASYLGIPYIQVAAMAVLPAILYYLSILIVIACLVRRIGYLPPLDRKLDMGIIRSQLFPFLVPVTVLVYCLVQGYSEETSVLAAIVALVVSSMAKIDTITSRAGFLKFGRQLFNGLVSGARQGAALAIVIAIVSLIAQSLISTALGPKLASAITSAVGDNVGLGLVLVMASALVLGCGLPTVVDYTLIAIVVLPSLTRLGVEPASAHMFAYFFAVYAAVTPPVATAALLASRMAGANYWMTGWASCRLLLAPSLIPFLFVYHSAILKFPWNIAALASPLWAWFIAAIAFAAVSVGHLVLRMRLLDYLLCTLAGLATVLWTFGQGYLWLVGGTILVTATLFMQSMAHMRKRKANLPLTRSAPGEFLEVSSTD